MSDLNPLLKPKQNNYMKFTVSRALEPQTLQKTSISKVLLCLSSFTLLFLTITHFQTQFPSVSSTRFLETNEQSSNTSTTIQKYVLLLIIIFFVVVPALVIIIFISICIYKKCTQVQGELQPTDDINLEEYNIDEMGPYLVNSYDSCSICLDTRVNIRTFCGHFFHPACLKSWFDKKAQENRKPTCPVCVGEVTNPIKLYCKKCFASVKLGKLTYISTQQTITQFDSLECNACKKASSNDDSFTQSEGHGNSVSDNFNSSNKNHKNHKVQENTKQIDKKVSKKQKHKRKPYNSNTIDEPVNSDIKINVNNDL